MTDDLEIANEIAKDYVHCGSNRMGILAAAVIRLTEERDRAIDMAKYYAYSHKFGEVMTNELNNRADGKKAREFLEGLEKK